MVTNDDVAENLPEGYTYDSEEYDENADDGGEEYDSGDGEEDDEFPGIPKQEKVPKKNSKKKSWQSLVLGVQRRGC